MTHTLLKCRSSKAAGAAPGARPPQRCGPACGHTRLLRSPWGQGASSLAQALRKRDFPACEKRGDGYTWTTKRSRRRAAGWRRPPSPGAVTDSEAAPQRTKKPRGLSWQTGAILGRARPGPTVMVTDAPTEEEPGSGAVRPARRQAQAQSPPAASGRPEHEGPHRALGRLQGRGPASKSLPRRRPSVHQGGAQSEGTPRGCTAPRQAPAGQWDLGLLATPVKARRASRRCAAQSRLC